MDYLNPVTTVALLTWPVVAVWLYKTRPIGQATLWTVLGAYMLLPVGPEIKIPMIPGFNKSSIPNLAALLGCLIVSRRSIRLVNGLGTPELLIAVLMVGPFITCELNADPVPIGMLVLPGLGGYEAGSTVIAQSITLIPFLLGRQFLCNRKDIEDIVRALAIAGLIYSLPTLFEIRFSPQLHTWLYGFFPRGFGFEDQFRNGGFRPVVFMGHGLLVSFFICTTTVAAAALWRTNIRVTRMIPAGIVAACLSFVLLLCKTASSLVYGATLVPLVIFAKPRIQIAFAVILVSLALSYPTLRAAGLVPTETLLNAASAFGPERQGSLNVRFRNEDELLERASQRFYFGWGTYGRSFIYNEYGTETSATDGLWVIIMGEFGIVGFLALFGLLSLPVFNAARALRFAESIKDKMFLAALALILAINVFDLLPNSPLRPWTFLLAGALVGRTEELLRWARFPPAVRTAMTSPKHLSNTAATGMPSASRRRML